MLSANFSHRNIENANLMSSLTSGGPRPSFPVFLALYNRRPKKKRFPSKVCAVKFHSSFIFASLKLNFRFNANSKEKERSIMVFYKGNYKDAFAVWRVWRICILILGCEG